MSADTWDVCTTDGCDGDARYAAPGRGHIDGCRYPSDGWARLNPLPSDTLVDKFLVALTGQGFALPFGLSSARDYVTAPQGTPERQDQIRALANADAEAAQSNRNAAAHVLTTLLTDETVVQRLAAAEWAQRLPESPKAYKRTGRWYKNLRETEARRWLAALTEVIRD